MEARILVVGGAGYIGSICASAMARAGLHTVTYDDLSTGHREAVTGDLIVGDVRDRAHLARVLREGHFDGVMHFAARSLVGESVEHPLRYYDVNTGGTACLLDAMDSAGVRALVFSSTCAIYGVPEHLPLTEDHPRHPVSPYGDSKEMIERMLAAVREREGFRVTTLRYFNAAGAAEDGSLGESHAAESHLIPLALDAALGRRPPLTLYGDDYDTRDGTCVRDYISVLDLADAHMRAMARLLDGDTGDAFNVGTGEGTTVREVLSSVERVLGTAVPHSVGARRPGDPPALYADPSHIQRNLGWQARHASIDAIVRTAARWAQHRRY